MKDYVLSESFFICQDTAGDPLEGSAVPSEMACLVYDYKLGQLVDFHLFTVSEKWERAKIQKLFERFLLLAELNDGSVPRVLRHGRVDGMVFYTAALEEGEVLTDYVRRIGPLPEQVVLELIGELVTNLLRLQEWPQLFRSCSLEGARLIFSPQGLQDRRLVQIRNFGLNSSEVLEDEAAAEHHLAVEVARLIYLLLTGFVSPQRGGPMVGAVRLLDLSVPLRAFVESSFENGLQQLTLLQAAQAIMAAQSFLNSSQAETVKLAAFEVDWSNLIFNASNQDLLYPEQFETQGVVPLRTSERACRPAVDRHEKKAVFLLPLPGHRVLPRPEFAPVPLGLDEIPPEAATHLCFPQSTWRSDTFCFHVESLRHGFSLRELMIQRNPFSAEELIYWLREIQTGLEQAKTLNLPVPSLQASAIQCVFESSQLAIPPSQLVATPLAEWPPHQIQVRVHATLESITAPWPVGAGQDRPESGRLADAFLLLALDLVGNPAALESREVRSLLDQQACLVRKKGVVLDPGALVAALERALDQRGKEPGLTEEAPSDALESTSLPTEAFQTKVPEPEIIATESVFAELESKPEASEPPVLETTQDVFDHDSEATEDGAPILNIDLGRLTTSDSLFSRQARTITIRNK